MRTKPNGCSNRNHVLQGIRAPYVHHRSTWSATPLSSDSTSSNPHRLDEVERCASLRNLRQIRLYVPSTSLVGAGQIGSHRTICRHWREKRRRFQQAFRERLGPVIIRSPYNQPEPSPEVNTTAASARSMLRCRALRTMASMSIDSPRAAVRCMPPA